MALRKSFVHSWIHYKTIIIIFIRTSFFFFFISNYITVHTPTFIPTHKTFSNHTSKNKIQFPANKVKLKQFPLNRPSPIIPTQIWRKIWMLLGSSDVKKTFVTNSSEGVWPSWQVSIGNEPLRCKKSEIITNTNTMIMWTTA